MIPHVKLADNQVMIPTPNGPHYISPSSFNYHKILSMLPTHELDDILPLFSPPETPNGVYYLYSLGNSIQYVNYTLNKAAFLSKGSWWDTDVDTTNESLLGVFTSIAEIEDTFPEHFI